MYKKAAVSQLSFRDLMYQQLLNSRREPSHTYLKYMYSLINRELPTESSNSKILEVGAGPGIGFEFLNRCDVLQTDLLPWPKIDRKILSEVDAHNLSFEDNLFDAVFAVDALHHLHSPIQAIGEMLRVTKLSGRLILVEPYVSWLSFPIYRLFHHEKTTWRFRAYKMEDFVSTVAEDGDQGVSKHIFTRISTDDLEQKIGLRIKIDKLFFSPLSFFATGGLTRTLPIPKSIIKFLIHVERLVPKFLLPFCSARILIVIERLAD